GRVRRPRPTPGSGRRASRSAATGEPGGRDAGEVVGGDAGATARWAPARSWAASPERPRDGAPARSWAASPERPRDGAPARAWAASPERPRDGAPARSWAASPE